MGIDNGTNTVGVVIMDYDIRKDKGQIIFSETLVAEKTAYSRYADLAFHRDPFQARLKVIGSYFDELLDQYNPHVVGCESPFSHSHVHAFATLLMSMDVIETCVYEYRASLEFIKVSPFTAKRTVCPPGKFGTDKDYIRNCVLSDTRISTISELDITLFDEHQIDATAVALTVARSGGK